jgi:hypothetical protein
MMADAESHAEEDKARREEAEIRNNGDSLVYQTEKFIADNVEKLSEGEAAEKKTEVEAALAELKTSLGGANFEAIKSNTEKVATLSQALGSAMYAAAGAAAGDGAAAEDGVEDAEVVEDEGAFAAGQFARDGGHGDEVALERGPDAFAEDVAAEAEDGRDAFGERAVEALSGAPEEGVRLFAGAEEEVVVGEGWQEERLVHFVGRGDEVFYVDAAGGPSVAAFQGGGGAQSVAADPGAQLIAVGGAGQRGGGSLP